MLSSQANSLSVETPVADDCSSSLESLSSSSDSDSVYIKEID